MPKKFLKKQSLLHPVPYSRQKELAHHETQETSPGQELLKALASMRLDPRYSDLTILCGDGSFAVHRCIVCTRSDFFSRACDGLFTEAFTRTIRLEEEPALVKQMIEYFYTLDYQVPPGNEEHKPTQSESEVSLDNPVQTVDVSEQSDKPTPAFDPLLFHILMYSLADRMFIKGLKVLSQQNVERELVQRLDANSFPQAIREIYLSTPENDRGLRDSAIKITMDHLTSLRSQEEANPTALENELLKSTPQFSYDLLVAIMNKSVSTWNRGLVCGKNWVERMS